MLLSPIKSVFVGAPFYHMWYLYMLIVGFAVELLIVFLRYRQALAQIGGHDLQYGLISPLSPLIVVSAAFIFAGFSLIKIDRNFGKLSSGTFLIYLFHAGVWEICMFAIKYLAGDGGDNRVVIPVCVVTVFVLSWLLSLIYKRIWKCLDERWRLSDKFCRLFRLSTHISE